MSRSRDEIMRRIRELVLQGEDVPCGLAAEMLLAEERKGNMTAEEAKALGYEVIKASPFEVGLVKGDRGIRTWRCQDFDRRLPPLDHPKILEAIAIHENYLANAPHQARAVASRPECGCSPSSAGGVE